MNTDSLPENSWDSKPGDMFSLDTDLTLYWPVVRKCWEENKNDTQD